MLSHTGYRVRHLASGPSETCAFEQNHFSPDGIVSVIVAQVGENIQAGQPVLVIEASGKLWLSFNAREDLLRGLTVGSKVKVGRAGTHEPMPVLVSEMVPLGSFATWQAERAIGDHDRNTLRLRLDPQGDPTGLEPGMAVWLDR